MATSSTFDISALTKPSCYPHPVERVEIIETHISWVFLAGKFAYKVKKPVNFGFLDFSDLAKRQHFCTEELRLNKRLAPKLYLNVLPIVVGPLGIRFGGPGEIVEYAVQMRCFSQDERLDNMLERGKLKPNQVDALASLVAQFHSQVAVAAPDSEFGTPESIWAPVAENFAQIEPLLDDEKDRQELAQVRDWSVAAFEGLRELIGERKAKGFVRECHGDLHLANLVYADKHVTAFDCLEFNPALRWLDVMSDVAFLVMDFQQRGHDGLSARFLDGYLSKTGDYAGVALLAFYQTYRAMVRAKVARLRLAQPGVSAKESELLKEQYAQYLALAKDYTATPKPALIIMHGISGSGKTVVSQQMVEYFSAVRVRSDVERKRLFGVPTKPRKGAKVGEGIYSEQASEQTYAHLAELAGALLRTGVSVIVDAAFLKANQRALLQGVALAAGVPFAIVDCHAPVDTLKSRVAARGRSDASDADISVVDQQLKTYEPITDDEWAFCVGAETYPEFAEATVVGEINSILRAWKRVAVSA